MTKSYTVPYSSHQRALSCDANAASFVEGTSRAAVAAVIASYHSRIIRTYCFLRFQIFRQRFLDEIEQYLPQSGRVVDLGCGFGLFALYFAMRRPDLTFACFDLSPTRIFEARQACERLKLTNVSFAVADVAAMDQLPNFDVLYTLDLIHHMPREKGAKLIQMASSMMGPGARLVIKDVDTAPTWKMAFTWLLDKMMDPKGPVDYWSQRDMLAELRDNRLSAIRHVMVDYLPYPHVIYVATKP